jgi:hypothetical protein
LRKLTLKTDRPMLCFDNGTNVREFANLFDTAADEQSRRRRDYERINRFWLVEMPIMISASLSKCDLDRSVTDDLKITSELARKGLATGLAMSLLGFYDQNRGHYIKSVLKNPHSVQAGSLIENFAIRQGTTYLLELLTHSLKPADFQALGQVMTGMAVDNLSDQSLDQWIALHFRDPALTELRTHVAALPVGQRKLIQLLARLESQGPNDLAMHVRMALAGDTGVSVMEQANNDLLARLLDDEVRPNLKKVAAAVVGSWGHEIAGFGGLFEFLAQSVALSTERPFQEALSSFLSNETDYETVVNFMVRYSADPTFHEALRFTGELAADGNLDRLISFLLDFFSKHPASQG